MYDTSNFYFMYFEILSQFYFSLILIALICFVEILINFNKTFYLKFFLLLISISILFLNASLLYCLKNGYNRWIIELPKTIIALSGVNIIFFLLFQQRKTKILFITFFIFLFHILIIYLLTNIIKIDVSINKLNEFEFFKRCLKYIFIVIILIFFIRQKDFIKRKLNEQNVYHLKIINWCNSFVFIISFHLAFVTVLIFLPKSFSNFESIEMNFLICMIILFRPIFLNKNDFTLSLSNTFNKNFGGIILKEKFKIEFFENMYFIKKTASIEDFSEQINFNKEILNEYILIEYGLNFIDLINKSRIDFFIQTIHYKKFKNLTIDALAEQVGFGSRPSLYRSFKKFHGGTPTDLIKSLS